MTKAKKPSRARKPSNPSELTTEELLLLCHLRLACQMRHHAQKTEKALLKWGRKQGYDVEKVVKAFDQWRVEIRKKYPNGILTGGWPEGF